MIPHAKAAAETKASQRVARMTGPVNICESSENAGKPIAVRPRPPKKSESPVALMADMVGLILWKMMTASEPLAVAVSMKMAPRKGLPAPAPGA